MEREAREIMMRQHQFMTRSVKSFLIGVLLLRKYNMKNINTCPKCRSGNIVRIDGYAGPYGSGNNIMTGVTVFSAVNVNRYVCCDCGYTEEWIDREDLEKVKKSKKAKK